VMPVAGGGVEITTDVTDVQVDHALTAVRNEAHLS